MQTRFSILAVAGCLAGSLAAQRALAADHLDGTTVLTDPSTDITDVYAWTTSDASKVNLVMNVFPKATTTATFSNAAQYVFHTSSCAAYTGTGCSTGHSDIICTFDSGTPQKVSCWVGTASPETYATGDASAATGITSADSKLKVFTGLRNDPFFFNLDGFHTAVATITGAKGSLTFDTAGCPTLDGLTSSTLVKQLSTNPNDGGPAIDFFQGLNVLSIVLQVDKSLLTSGGPVLGVWASTNK